MIGTLLILPLVVYVITYIPWAVSTAGGPQLFPGWPPGHTGQTLLELTKAMYHYHNTCAPTHPASSPFWAWPFDLKPVWFYQGSFAGDTAAGDLRQRQPGHLVARRSRRSPSSPGRRSSEAAWPLGLITIGFVLQWVPWMRIDRATFQYHYYTSLPFLVIALAYFLAELWHGASRRTWLLARVSAALVVLGPGLLWVFKGPLCDFVRVNVGQPRFGRLRRFDPG